MTGRRPLTEALKPKPDANRGREEQFVYGDQQQPAASPAPAAVEVLPGRQAPAVGRVPFTTRFRADLAQALKRASLERQLRGVQPNTVQDILEQALEPWLRAHGYLS